MSIRPLKPFVALILLVAATSVATSQSPQVSDPSSLGERPAAPGAIGSGEAWAAGSKEARAGQTASRAGAAGDMIGFSHSDDGGTQTITLVNTRKSWIAVYHIDRSGKIRLVSSRPIDADFSLQLNATSPLPEEIRRIGKR